MFTGGNAGVLWSWWVNHQVLERLPIEGDVTKELEKELVQLLALEKTRTASRQHKELEERILRRAEEQVASSACFSVATSLQLMVCTPCATALAPMRLGGMQIPTVPIVWLFVIRRSSHPHLVAC